MENRHPVAEYALTYVSRFNELCDEAKEPVEENPLFLQRVSVVAAYQAADGILLLFFPEGYEQKTSFRPGLSLYDWSDKQLSVVAQSLSANLVKVTPAPTEPLRGDLSNPPPLPADLPDEQIVASCYNPEIVDEKWSTDIRMTGVAVAPMRRYVGGLVAETMKSRFHLFSPILTLPSGRKIRQYEWLFADFLWSPDLQDIARIDAKKSAEEDVNILRLAREANLSPEKSPFQAVSEHMVEVCDRLEELINNPETTEPQVQAFLEEPAHQFLIAPAHKNIFPRKPIGGKYVTDFVVELADGDYELIEIESPNKAIYQQAGEEPTAHFTHAITQVEDWLRFVDDNRDTTRREYGLPGIYRPRGRVIAGRDSHLGEAARRRFDFKRNQYSRLKLLTYDIFLSEARAYAEVVGAMRPETSTTSRK